jgi:Domain of unknown function (DUF4020)
MPREMGISLSSLELGYLWQTLQTVQVARNWQVKSGASQYLKDWRHWAKHITRYLRELSIESRMAVWNRWMHEYWEQRVMGLPRPLDADEYAEMLKWLAHLEPVIQEVLPLIEDGPKP